MKNAFNAIYGKGEYFLPFIRGNHEKDYLCSDLSDTERKDFLDNPRNKDITYICKAHLFSTYYEFKNYINKFHERWKHNAKQDCILSLPISKVQHQNKRFYLLDLNKLTCSNGSYWLSLVDTQYPKHPKEIARVFIDKRAITLYTKSPFIIEGPKEIPALTVHSTSEIQIASSLNTEKSIFIFSSGFNTHPGTKLNTQNVLIFCQQYCELNGNIYASDLMIKAGEIAQWGTIELENEAVFFTEKGKNTGNILAKQKIESVSLEWIDTAESHIHSPGIVRKLSAHYTTEGLISTNKLHTSAEHAHFSGQIFSALETFIHADLHIEMTVDSQFILSGVVYETSNWGIDACGKTLFFAQNVGVEWKQLNTPNTDAIFSKLLSHAPQGVAVNPYVAPFTESRTDKLLAEYRKKPKPHSVFSIYGKSYVNLQGILVVQDADISLESQYRMNIEGTVWNNSLSREYQNFIQCQVLECKGDLQLGTDLKITALKNIDHTGHIECNKLAIHASNYDLRPHATMKAQEVTAKIENNVTLSKDSNLEVNDKFIMQCRNFYNYSILKSPTLYIEAQRLIYNWCGRFEGRTHHLVAPWVFLIGNIKVHQFSITSLGCVIMGFSRCGSLSSNTLISITPLLSLQTAIMPPNLLSLGITGANLLCLALNVVCPPTITFTMPALIALNSLSRAVSVYSQISHLLATTQHPPTMGTTLKRIIGINQLALSLLSMGFIGYGSYQSLCSGMTLPAPVTSVNLMPLLERSIAYVFQSLSGYSNFSMIALDPSIFMGISRVNYNFFSLNLGGMLGISQINNSLFMMDNGYNLTLGPSSSMGWGLYDTGNTLALMGQNSICYQQIMMDPIVPISHLFTNIQAHQLIIKQNIQFQNSNLDINFVQNNSAMQLLNTQYRFQTMDNGSQGVLSTAGSNVVGNTLNNQGLVLQSHCKITYEVVHNQNRLQFIISEVKIGDFLLDPKTITAIDLSHVEINNLNVSRDAALGVRSSGCTVHHVVNNGNTVIENSTWYNDTVENNINITFVHTVADVKTFTKHHGKIIDKTEKMNHTAPMPKVEGYFSNGILHYTTPGTYHISNDIISCVPVEWTGSGIVVSGNAHATTDLILNTTTNNLNFQNANMSVDGATVLKSVKDIRFKDSNLVSQDTLVIDAKGKVHNEASNLWAQKAVYVHGEQGIESTAKIEQVTTKHTHWQWHGLKSGFVTTTEVHTVVTQPSVVSATGVIKFEAPQGAILSIGTQFYGYQAIAFDASGPVLLNDARVQNASQGQSYSLLGYQSVKDTNEASVPTQCATTGAVTINTPSDVQGIGTEVQAKNLLINGKSSTFERPILNHHHTSTRIGFLAWSSPILDHTINPLQAVPIIQSALQITHAKSTLGLITSTLTFSIEIVNECNSFLRVLKQATAMGSDVSWATLLLKPMLMNFISQTCRIDVTAGIKKNALDYQTLGPGGFDVENLEINAQKIAFDHAFGLKAKTGTVNAPEVTFSGAALKVFQKSSTDSITVGIDILGNVSGSAHHHSSVQERITHVQYIPQVENLVINTDHLTLKSAQLKSNLTGNIKEIHTISEPDFYYRESQGLYISSGGQIGYSTQVDNNGSEYHFSISMNVLPSKGHVFQTISFSEGHNHQPGVTFTLPIVNLKNLSKFEANVGWAWNQMFSEPPKTTLAMNSANFSLPINVPHREQNVNRVIPARKHDKPQRTDLNTHSRDSHVHDLTFGLPSNLAALVFAIDSTEHLNNSTPPETHKNNHPSHLNTASTEFSIYDPLILVLNDLSTPAFAEETPDQEQNVNEVNNPSMELNSEDFSLLSGLSTLAFASAAHDRSILKEAYGSYQYLINSEYPNLYAELAKQHPTPYGSYNYMKDLEVLLIWRPSNKMSSFSHSLFDIEVEPNFDRRIASYKDCLGQFEQTVSESLFSPKGISFYNATAWGLQSLAAFSTAYHLDTAPDKIEALKTETLAFLGGLGGAAFGETLLYDIDSFLAKTAFPYIEGSQLLLNKCPYIVFPLTIASSLIGADSVLQIDNNMNGQELPAVLGWQALSDWWDYQAHQSIYPQYQDLYNRGLKSLASDVTQLHPSQILGSHVIEYSFLVEQFRDKASYVTAANTNLADAHTLRNLLYDIQDDFRKLPAELQLPLLQGDYLNVWKTFNELVQNTNLSSRFGMIKNVSYKLLGGASLYFAEDAIWKAPDKFLETEHQISLFAGGVGGAYLGGLAISPICGPGAPICAGAFTIGGAIVGTWASDNGWNAIEKLSSDTPAPSDNDLEYRSQNTFMPMYNQARKGSAVQDSEIDNPHLSLQLDGRGQ